jgi:hypothetical protein
MSINTREVAVSIRNTDHCKRLADPIDKNTFHMEAMLPFSKAAKLDRGNANVRPFNELKKPFKEMLATVDDAPGTFHLKDRGITYLCEGFEFDNQRKELTIAIPDIPKSSFGWDFYPNRLTRPGGEMQKTELRLKLRMLNWFAISGPVEALLWAVPVWVLVVPFNDDPTLLAKIYGPLFVIHFLYNRRVINFASRNSGELCAQLTRADAMLIRASVGTAVVGSVIFSILLILLLTLIKGWTHMEPDWFHVWLFTVCANYNLSRHEGKKQYGEKAFLAAKRVGLKGDDGTVGGATP